MKFIDLIVKISKTTYMNSSQSSSVTPPQLDMTDFANQNFSNHQKLLDVEMLCLLLERMELSKGFSTFEKKTHKPHTSKITMLPSRHLIRSIEAAKTLVN